MPTEQALTDSQGNRLHDASGNVILAGSATEARLVTLAEAKAHLHVVDFTDDDAYITASIDTAVRAIEDCTRRSLLDTNFQQTRYAPTGWPGAIRLLRGGAHTLSAVEYTDPHGTTVALEEALYRLVPHSDGCADVCFASSFSRPALTNEPGAPAIVLRYRAGFGPEPDDVPLPLRQAVLYLVQHYYDQRAPVAVNVNLAKMPFAVESLIAPYVIYQYSTEALP